MPPGKAQRPLPQRRGERTSPFLVLLLISRAAAAGTAVALLAAHRVTGHDGALVVVVLVHTGLWMLLLRRYPSVIGRPWFWLLDLAIIHAMLWDSSDWRSPFYLLVLTSLALPAAHVGPRRALLYGLGYSTLLLLTGHLIGPDPFELGTQASLETLAIHLVLPVIACFGIGYAVETLRKLGDERARAERLAIEAERRRIAWELHDSAKQRIHAAHLVLSSAGSADRQGMTAAIEHAMGELGAASADMDTSLAELRSPLEGRPLAVALRERAEQLVAGGGPQIEVRGELPQLPPLHAAHAYRIAGEALTNALRHARAERVVVELSANGEDVVLSVTDDGRGMPANLRPGASGLHAMDNRARTLNGVLRITRASERGGTRVEVRFPKKNVEQEEPQ